jgi:hypothetical protein
MLRILPEHPAPGCPSYFILPVHEVLTRHNGGLQPTATFFEDCFRYCTAPRMS